MTVWRIPRESVELIGPITVTEEEEVIESFDVALLPVGTRPTEDDWAAPEVVESNYFILVGPGTDLELDPGSYLLWARYTANPEIPVLNETGTIYIT